MRRWSTLAAAGAATLVTLTPVTAAPKAPLAAKRGFAGGTVAGHVACAPACRMTFAVRPGERYLHVLTTPLGWAGYAAPSVVVDVTTPDGTVRVCRDTADGPIALGGLTKVTLVGVADDLACGLPPSPGGTVLAVFSDRALSYEEAVRSYRPDPDRPVSGGV